MALPAPKDRRPAAKRPRRAPPGQPAPPARPAPSGPPAPPAPPRPAPARDRRRQAEEAARERAAGQRTRGLTRDRRATERASKRNARRAGRAERDARLLARLRHILQWTFPEHTRRVGRGWSVLILVLNIVPFPGLGTALYGHWERGVMQFLLTFLFLVGWVWAVFDGIRIVSASWRPPPDLRRQPTSRSTR